MCKACKMDDREVARLYARQGAVEVEDFDDEIRYRKPPSKTQYQYKHQIQRRPGCPENNNKKHVYVWTQENENEKAIFFRYFGYHKSQTEVCVGCGKEGKSKASDSYQRRKDREWERLDNLPKGSPVPRYRRGYYRYASFRWEDEIEEYREFRSAILKREGWQSVHYGRYHW